MNKLGVFNLRELARYPLANLLNQFGIWGYVLHEMANFRDSGSVVSDEQSPKSFGHAYTVGKAFSDMRAIKKLMFKLSEKVGRRMRRHGASGNVVHYFNSDKQGDGYSKQRKIGQLINDGRDIFQTAWQIFSENHLGTESVKIMGVSISGLVFEKTAEPLFEQYKKPGWLIAALDRINDKYGDYTITRGRLLGSAEEWAKDTVGFGRTRSNPKR